MENTLIVLALAACLIGLMASSGCKELLGDPAYIEWECGAVGPTSLQCVYKNTGGDSGEACFDAVVICGSTRHVAHKCSGKMEPGSMTTKVVSGFSPSIPLDCAFMGMQTENEVVR